MVWHRQRRKPSEIRFQIRNRMQEPAITKHVDMFRDGGLLHPIAYLKAYFGRLPALSMPYHPPVFPAVEALFYAALGIRPATPRIAVAFTVFGSVLSLYYVVLKTQRSVTV